MNYKNAINDSKKGILIKLHVSAGSSQSIFPAGYNEWRRSIEIKTKAEAKENKANKEIISKIAEYFDILAKNISITSGKNSKDKIILIKNVPIAEIYKKLEGKSDGL